MNKTKFVVISGVIILYIVRSQAVSATSIIQQLQPQKSVKSQAFIVPRISLIQGEPDELIIPSLNMDLKIIPGYYNARTGTWTLSLSEVQYATITPEPNNLSGNTFLYGHYRSAVFARLHSIQAGAQAIVKTTNGHALYYQLSGIRTTDPNDDSVFEYSGPPILTIQTCTGVLFQYRQLFTFTLLEAI